MNEAFRAWLSGELDRRNWSQREFARQAGLSQSFVTQVLAGKRSPSVNFLTKTSAALDESLDKLLKLAGILPSELDISELTDSPITREILQLVHNMTPGQRKEALRYLRYLYQSGKEE